ncbi:hypothetical protein [Marinomonas sp. ef1]|uniref:hypothetical protein n=1 Tax=Marinomonas sp. ef1 TaxID=2005043 RepID=UPI000C287FAE|nr:hypothetical protein [Marinomonas sp. ef1]
MSTITVSDLKKMLELYDNDFEISFSGLDFHRLKTRGPKLVQVEFNEVIYRNSEGKMVLESIE